MSANPVPVGNKSGCPEGSRSEQTRKRDSCLHQHADGRRSELQVHIHLSKRASESDLPVLLEKALEQEGQLQRDVAVVTHEARQRELRRVLVETKESSKLPSTDNRSCNLTEQLRAVERLINLLQHTCLIYMPSEIVTHVQLLHRSHDGTEDTAYSCPGADVYRHALILPLYTPEDLAVEATTQTGRPQLSPVNSLAALPWQIERVLTEVNNRARVVCLFQGIRAALTVPQPHVTAAASTFPAMETSCSLPLLGSPFAPSSSEPDPPVRTPSCARPCSYVDSSHVGLPRAGDPRVSWELEDNEVCDVPLPFSTGWLDEMICKLLVDFGVDTLEPLNAVDTAMFLVGAVKHLRRSAQITEPVELHQRIKRRRRVSTAAMRVFSELAAGCPTTVGTPEIRDSSLCGRSTGRPSAYQQAPPAREAEPDLAVEAVHEFACRLWAEQLVQIPGVTEKVAGAVLRKYRRPADLLDAIQVAETEETRGNCEGGNEARCGPRAVEDESPSVAGQPRGRLRGRKKSSESRVAAVIRQLAELEVPGLSADPQHSEDNGVQRLPKVGKSRAERICRLFQSHVDVGSPL